MQQPRYIFHMLNRFGGTQVVLNARVRGRGWTGILPGHSRQLLHRVERITIRSIRAVKSVSVRGRSRSEEHTSELQSLRHLVCRLLLEKKTTIDQLSAQ